jgi:uncharacterized membrane protein YgdD (TMEM256/DUF423 family)
MDTALRLPLLLAALSGALAVAAGAFGAHGAASEQARGWLQTGGGYQLAHAVAAVGAVLLVRAGLPAAVWAAWLFVIGAAVFAGALYGLALGGPRVLGAVAPIGGLLMIAGWLVIAWAAFTGSRSA